MSIPVQIPESLTQNKKWADWLAELPAILIACAKKWTLRIEAPLSEDYAQMSFGYITPATRADGEKVILKCVPRPFSPSYKKARRIFSELPRRILRRTGPGRNCHTPHQHHDRRIAHAAQSRHQMGGYFVLHLVEMRFRRLEGELARRHPTRRGIRRSIIKAI